MNWFNYYGLAIMAIIMIPNIIYAVKNKQAFENKYKNKSVEIIEQISRYACFALMIFNIPYTYFDFWFNGALTVYISVNCCLCLLYCVFWIICRNPKSKSRALSLSVIPSLIFLFSGIVLAYILLMVFAIAFGICHVWLSYKNAV